MDLNLQITRGDQFYYEVPFLDQYGRPIDLTNWTIQVGFKKSFGDRKAYFILTQANDGLAFKDDDATSGILCLLIDADQFSDLDLTALPHNGEQVPFQLIYGDIKMTPPDQLYLVPAPGSRPAIILKVRAGVTR